MNGFPANLRRDEGLEVLEEDLANDCLDLSELRGQMTKGQHALQIHSHDLT